MTKRTVLIRRTGAALLALLLLALCAPVAHAAEPGFLNFQNRVNTYADGMFSDVGEEWYTEYVAAVYELGLMQGDTAGRFAPDASVTLAETVALAARLHQTYYTGSAAFEQGDPWYRVYVDYCLDNGILAGEYGNYNMEARRSEFAGILSRALPVSALPLLNDIAPGDIPDVPADSAEADGIYRLYRAGVLTGNDVYGTFAPDSEIRRSEVAAIVSRMAYRSFRRSVTLLPKPPYPDPPETERLDDDAFADAAMLGNSLVDGMRLFSGLKMDYYGRTGATVLNNRLSDLLTKQYGKVYIEFGINEIGLNLDTLVGKYRSIVQSIRAAMPEAEIYVMSITPVTKFVSYQGSFSMSRINEVNAALRAMAEEEQCWYLDCCTPLCDAEGYLIGDYAGWDGSPHLAVSGYIAWAEVIRTHGPAAEK